MKNPKICLLIKPQSGFVLVTVMLFLTLLSLSAFVAVEQSQFSYKVNSARLAQMKARSVSEEARLTSVSELEALLKRSELKIDTLTSSNISEENNMSGFKLFSMKSRKDVRSEVYVKVFPSQISKNGVSLTQHAGYLGVGEGLGNFGSFTQHFEIMSKGIAQDKGQDVSSWTASDYRFLPN